MIRGREDYEFEVEIGPRRFTDEPGEFDVTFTHRYDAKDSRGVCNQMNLEEIRYAHQKLGEFLESQS